MDRSVYLLILIAAGTLLSAGTVAAVLLSSWLAGERADSGASCSLPMFGNRTGAFWACRVQAALQQNWFPDPIQGLFSYQTWNGMDGFWQNGVAVESSANAMHYLNTTRYRSVVVGSYRSLEDLLLAYGPEPSYDDMAWYGLAYTRVYEVLHRAEFLTISQTIFDWIWRNGWDTNVCSGGIWFDDNQSGKQTIENVQMVQLGARLARLLGAVNASGSHDYLEKALLIWHWIEARQLYDNVTHQVFDGISLDSCTCTDRTTFTYTSGTLLGGLVELFKVTKDVRYLATAHNISAAAIRNLTTAEGVLVEPCDRDATCDLDANIFKGIFMKNLRYLLDADPGAAASQAYRKFVATNIAAVKKNAMCEPGNSSCHIVYLGSRRSFTT